jgi:hypothetical protein
MAETSIWQSARVRQAHGRASQASTASGDGGSSRLGVRLWALLHAPALLGGASGGPGDVAYIEDDARRLAARRLR